MQLLFAQFQKIMPWVKKFRSISLITNLYKSIAKIFSLRLIDALESTILDGQWALVKSRQILYVLIINEIVVDYKRNNKKLWFSRLTL